MGETLFLFTNSFPFGTGETFIENEIEYLSEVFHKIIIISSEKTNIQTRKVPNNVFIEKTDNSLSVYQKIISYLNLINQNALLEILDQRVFSFHKINYLCQSYFRAQRLKQQLYFLCEKYQITPNSEELFLYTYWWLDEAIGVSLFKKENIQCKAFTRCHGYDLYFHRSPKNYLPLKKFCSKYLNQIYSISEDGKKYLNNKLNITNVTVSRLGTIRNTSGINTVKENNEFTIVSCGAIYPNKNILTIAKAINMTQITNLTWIHFGDYIPDYSEGYYTELLKVTKKITDEGKINVLLKGNVPNIEILHFYESRYVDLFINASYSEGISVSIMEAMSYGIPCIATNVGGTSELVNNKNGFLISANPAIEEISLKIEEYYYLTADKKAEKRLNAFEYWKDNYNAKKNYRDFIEKILK